MKYRVNGPIAIIGCGVCYIEDIVQRIEKGEIVTYIKPYNMCYIREDDWRIVK